MSPDVCPAAVAQRMTVTTALNAAQLHKSKGNKNKGSHEFLFIKIRNVFFYTSH